ncbi:DUF3159 domain-containing protein [Cryptosporangium sp. NPDC048952]|uniref:DUF3159 domain-containing protein n=1 Tax=Cryptosporangium sp. NPDC048952 TaxID=3363961 RepID=UPI00371C7C79
MTDRKNVLFDQLGGPWGMVYTAVPVVAFVAANAVFGLGVAITVAVTVALGITALRLVRREPVRPALSGLLGVAVAAGVAAWSGSADGFFLIGIWTSAVLAVVTLVTVLVRRPATGLLWNLVHGNENDWRADRPSLTAHDIATLALTAMFAARFVVQQWLYGSEATGWLAVAKIAMGAPLLALVLLVVVWAFRRTSKRLTHSESMA